MPVMYRPLLLLTTAGRLEFDVLLTLSWGKGCYICTVLFPMLIYDLVYFPLVSVLYEYMVGMVIVGMV